MFVVCWQCTGVALLLRWYVCTPSAGVLLLLSWYCTGSGPVLYWLCIGSILVLHCFYTGTVLVLHRQCVGTPALHRAVSDPKSHRTTPSRPQTDPTSTPNGPPKRAQVVDLQLTPNRPLIVRKLTRAIRQYPRTRPQVDPDPSATQTDAKSTRNRGQIDHTSTANQPKPLAHSYHASTSYRAHVHSEHGQTGVDLWGEWSRARLGIDLGFDWRSVWVDVTSDSGLFSGPMS